ncbi:DUF2063 domain-containing protein [Dokdonella sp.]|uniref:HvfC family RiPP maturation protein n=1 Tax=Dokdonella sp. TaxID=2291710 RepID=UPI003784C772
MSAAPEAAATRAAQYAFAAHIRDPARAPAPADVEPRRMAIYTELFYNNIESLLAANFPVIRRLHDDDAWHGRVRDFYRDHHSRTPLFTEIAREFIRHLEQRAESAAGDPPFLLELAHYEWSELALSLDEAEIDALDCDAQGDVLNGVPVLSPLLRVLAYRYPVQHIGPDFVPTEPAPQPVLILLVRDRRDEVRFTEIDALTAMLIERLGANQVLSGIECLETLLHDLGRGGDESLRVGGRDILRLLRAREAIIGTARTPPA